MDLNFDEDQFACKVHAAFLDDDYSSESNSDFDELYEKYKPPPVELDDFDVVKIDRFSTVCTKAKIKKALYENRSKSNTLNSTANQKNGSKSRSKKGQSKGDSQNSKCNEKDSAKSVPKQTNSQNTKSIPPLPKIGCIPEQTLSYSQVAKLPKQPTPQIAVVTEAKKKKTKKRSKVPKKQENKDTDSQNTTKPLTPKKSARKTPKLVLPVSNEIPKHSNRLLLVSLEKPLQFESSTLTSSVRKSNIQPEDVKPPRTVPHKLKERSDKYGTNEEYPFCDELSKTFKSNELRPKKNMQQIYSDTQNISLKTTEGIINSELASFELNFLAAPSRVCLNSSQNSFGKNDTEKTIFNSLDVRRDHSVPNGDPCNPHDRFFCFEDLNKSTSFDYDYLDLLYKTVILYVALDIILSNFFLLTSLFFLISSLRFIK